MLCKIIRLSQISFSICAIFFLRSCKYPDEYEKNGIIEKGNVRIAYNRCVSGDTTLFFIHGWAINKEYWKNQETYFCKNYSVVTMDLPGFGASGKNRTVYDFEEYANDVKAIIDELKLKNVIAIGHSMSGDILLQLSSRFPESVIGIVGVDNLHEPGNALSPEEQRQTDEFFTMMENHFDSTINTYMRGGLFQPSTDTAIINRVLHDVSTGDSVIAINVLRSLAEVSQNEKEMMQNLSHTLYLVNSDVNAVDSAALAKYCKHGFHVELVHGTGHYPMLEAPDEFNKALERTISLIGKKD